MRGGLLVTVVGSLGPSSIDEWRAGRRVRMPVQLHRPSRYLDPGVPDNERMLARSGTTLVGTVKSGALVETIGYGRWWSEGLGGVRLFARRAIGRFVGRWSPQSAAIVTAIVIGDRAGLDDDVQRRLQEAGTYHVIAISGGNIAILAGLLLGAFRLAGCLGRGAMLAAIGVLVAYASLVGGGASVDRATLMAVVYFAARAFDQRSPPLNALWVVAAVLVATDPLSIADPAFGLTFGATLGILIVGPSWRQRSTQNPPKSQIVFCVCFASVYGDVRRVARGRGDVVSGRRAGVLARDLRRAGAELPGDSADGRRPTGRHGRRADRAGLYASCHGGGMGCSHRRRWARVVGRPGPVCAGADLSSRAAGVGRGGHLLRVDGGVLGAVAAAVGRVRQRRAAVCRARSTRRDGDRGARRGLDPRPTVGAAGRAGRWPAARHVSGRRTGRQPPAAISARVDDARGCGRARRLAPASTSATASSRPFCATRGIRHLDYVVLTHGDPDHIGGAAAIVREFRPREVWEGIPVPRFEPLTALRVQAQAVGAHWRNVYRGDRLSVDGVDIEAEHPAPADWERQKVRNDDSVVLDVRWRDVSVLLTGDIGREVERTFGDEMPPAPLQGAEGSASREPDVEQPGIPAGAPAADRGLQRRPGEPFRSSRAGGVAAVSRHRRGDLPNRSGRRRHARHRWALD